MRARPQTGPRSLHYVDVMSRGLLPDLTPRVRDRFLAAGIQRRYPARSYLFHEFDEASSVFLVERGLLRVDHTTRSGRRVLLDLASRGEFIGDLAAIDHQPRSATVSTVDEAQVICVTGSDFRALLRDEPSLSSAVLVRVIRRFRSLSNQLVEATSLSASARVAARLVRLIEITEAGPTDGAPFDLKLPITQEELGQWAGLSREGTVKGMGELRREGFIETGRRRVRVLDLEGLRSEATLVER